MNNYLTIIKSIFISKEQRDMMLKKNIIFSAVLKIISLCSSFLIVPVTLHYLNNEVYGIWMTITSILFWINTFDIGLGNGMRNYLTEALAKDNYKLGRAYISTTYALLGLIALIMILILIIPSSLLNFNDVFNTKAISNTELRNVMLVAVSFTLINFVLKSIGNIFIALQKYAISDLLGVSGGIIALLIIYVLTKITTGHLMYVVLAYTATFTAVYILAAYPVFKKYPKLKPSLKYFDKSISKQIVGKGLGFFAIQITSCLIIFGASNLFITQFCGPAEVTTYNIAYKFFYLLATAYTIVISPMWNAYTDAYVKGDMKWIDKTFRHALNFWGLSLLAGGLMLICSNMFYYLWVGKSVNVPFTVSLSVFAYISFFNLNNCVTYLINGLNKIRIQIITSIIMTIIYIAAVFSIGKNLGIEGIVGLMAISYAIMSAIHLYQCRLIIKGKAKGIWNK